MNATATRKASESPANAKGEIVVYQPNETMRLEVRLEDDIRASYTNPQLRLG